MNSSSNPKEMAERGEKIYLTRYKNTYETKYPGKYVAIDVETEKSYIGDSPLEVLDIARKDSPQGLFHLIKVGSQGAFRVSYTSNVAIDWLFR